MITTILISIGITLLVIFSIYFLYLWSTIKLQKDISTDIITIHKIFSKYVKRKKINKNELTIINKQVDLLRFNIDKFTNRLFLNKKQRSFKTEYKDTILEIEILFTKIRA